MEGVVSEEMCDEVGANAFVYAYVYVHVYAYAYTPTEPSPPTGAMSAESPPEAVNFAVPPTAGVALPE